jgi:hypothetical protein
MTSQSSERPLGNMVAAVSEDDGSSSASSSSLFVFSRTLPLPIQPPNALSRPSHDDPFRPRALDHERRQERASDFRKQDGPSYQHICPSSTSPPHTTPIEEFSPDVHSIACHRRYSYPPSAQLPSPALRTMSLSPSLRARLQQLDPEDAQAACHLLASARTKPSQSHEESQSSSHLTTDQNHHMRSSPPIQPGEQNFPGKLPSFSEVSCFPPPITPTHCSLGQFLSTTRQQTPPRTPSRRNGSADSSPHAKPHFDDVAWSDGKRRRVDTLGDIYARSSVAEHASTDSRRMSSAIDPALAGYASPRPAQHVASQPAGPAHLHRSSHSYPPPHVPQQSSPAPGTYSQQPSHSSMLAQSAYPPPLTQHAPIYEHRPSYYAEPQPAVYGYDRSNDPYYGRSSFAGVPHPGYDNSYGELRFQQHVGLDHNAFNRKRRGNLPKEATNILKDWFNANRGSPYPSEDQKMDLCSRTGLSLNQVCDVCVTVSSLTPLLHLPLFLLVNAL